MDNDSPNPMPVRKFKGQPRKTTLEDRSRTMIGLVALAVLAALMATLVIITKVGPRYKKVSADFIQAAALLPKNPGHRRRHPGRDGHRDEAQGRPRHGGDAGPEQHRPGKGLPRGHHGDHHPGFALSRAAPRRRGPLPNNTIDLNHTEVPYDLQQALQDVAVNYGEVNTDDLARAVEVLGKQIEGLPR